MTWEDWPGQVGWLDMMYGMHIEGSSYLDRYGGIWRYLDLSSSEETLVWVEGRHVSWRWDYWRTE